MNGKGSGVRFLMAIFCCALVLSGCAAISGPPLRRKVPVVYIHPLMDMYRQATVGVLPFQVPSNMAAEEGMRVAALFKDVLLGKGVFAVVRQLNAPYGDFEEAMEIGREQGVQLTLAGQILYALDGTELGGARVNVAVRLLNTRTGNTVWYIEQAMERPMEYPDAGLVSRFFGSFSPPPVRKPAGAPAVPTMLTRIAVDMAEVMAGDRPVL